MMKILSSTRLTNRLLMESGEATNIAPDTLMYRYCSDQEIECVVNGGQSGDFWLAVPYFGTEDRVYMRTPWNNLGRATASSYGLGDNQHLMTPNGRVGKPELVEVVRVSGGNPEPQLVPLEGFAWHCPELDMLADMEFPDGSPKVLVDDYSDPQISITHYRYDTERPFCVAVHPQDKIVQKFTRWEQAKQFCYKYVKEGFGNNLAHRT